MKTEENVQSSEATVHYEGAPIAEQQIDGMDYRVDAGRGSMVAVSRRQSGAWGWTLVGEGRWDGVRLRVKGLEHPVVASLGQALLQAMRDSSERGFD